MIRRILGDAMFIQKKSGLVKNDTGRNMTQNKLRTAAQPMLRSRWYLALVNLLIVGGAVVVPGEMVLGNPSCPKCGKPETPGYLSCIANQRACNHPASVGEIIFEQIQQRYPRAMQQLLKDDPRGIQKLRQGDRATLQRLQELAPQSKEQIQQLISNRRRQEWRLNHRRQHLNQSENNKE